MGRVQTAELCREYFNFYMSDRVAIQDIHSPGTMLGGNAKTRNVQWECIRDNWETVKAKTAGSSVVMDRYLRLSLNKFANRRVGEEIKTFFEGKDNRGYDRSLGLIQDAVQSNSAYKERDEGVIGEWLEAREYV